MSNKVFIDPGHGGHDSGAVGHGLKEKDVVLKIARYMRDALKNNYSDINVRMSRDSDRFVSLSKRASEANSWGADAFVSIHINAGGGTGYEDFIYNGSVQAGTRKLQDEIHAEVSKLFNNNRGQKRANFAVLRQSNMSAVLTENGFIDNKRDADFLKKNSNLKKIGEAHADGVASFLGLRKSSGGSSRTTSRARTSLTSSSSGSSSGVRWVGTDLKGKRVESIYRGSEGLNFYDGPRWDNPSGTFGYGEGWTIDNKYMVDGYPMYRVQNSKGDLYYITASPTYVKVEGASPRTRTTTSNYTGDSIVDYLKSINEESSFSNRKRLAGRVGISNYRGTESQNARLLKKLRGF